MRLRRGRVPRAVPRGEPAPAVRHFVHDDAVTDRIILNTGWTDVGSWNTREKIGTVEHDRIRWGGWLTSGQLLAPNGNTAGFHAQ
ncbi:hypothetical protein DQ353_20920 [Arthrobacter sp. AQ5-05]|nr:hypothetical protein DQ353_20920 [Arthrobacter sp. AQ5-05]